MKLLIVGLDFKPLGGGVAEYTHQIAHHLQEAGDEVVVLSQTMDKDSEFDAKVNYVIRRYDPAYFRTNLISFQTIKKVAKEEKPDLIISNFLRKKALMCWVVSRLLRIRYSIFTYGIELKKWDKGPIYKRPLSQAKRRMQRYLAIKKADKVFCVSSYTKAVVEGFGVSPQKTAVLLPGIASEFMHSIAAHVESDQVRKRLGLSGSKIILSVGRLIERKGFDMAVRAFEIVRKKIPDCVYILVGDGPCRADLEALTDRLDLADSIAFKGFVGETEKRSYYQIADAFIMPNRELEDGDVEGFGIVFLEANAYGLPVIGGCSGGAVDAIEDGKTGFLVDPWDAHEIASKLIVLLENEAYAAALGKEGKQRIATEFSWPKIVAGMRKELATLELR